MLGAQLSDSLYASPIQHDTSVRRPAGQVAGICPSALVIDELEDSAMEFAPAATRAVAPTEQTGWGAEANLYRFHEIDQFGHHDPPPPGGGDGGGSEAGGAAGSVGGGSVRRAGAGRGTGVSLTFAARMREANPSTSMAAGPSASSTSSRCSGVHAVGSASRRAPEVRSSRSMTVSTDVTERPPRRTTRRGSSRVQRRCAEPGPSTAGTRHARSRRWSAGHNDSGRPAPPD